MSGPLPGLMQYEPLLTSSILRYAARHHANGEIVSRFGPELGAALHRQSYAQTEIRARKLMRALYGLGISPGDRVATLAWNNHRHVEIYYATGGMGAVCNTVNPRLADEDVAYIIEHGGASVLFVEPDFIQLVGRISPLIAHAVEIVVVLCEAAAMPEVRLAPGMRLACYGDLMAAADEDMAWGVFDENTANVLCYTSGTTGRPKGVLYSHRSTVLHAMAMNTPDRVGARATDRILPIVQMFHVTAWGLPFMAPMAGASLIMPGRFLDGASLLELISAEQVSIAAGVPTVWFGVLEQMRKAGGSLSPLKSVLTGGSAPPRLLFDAFDALGVSLQQAWGMTESSPIVSYTAPVSTTAALPAEAQMAQRMSQGRAAFGVDLRARRDDDSEAPWDGITPGSLEFRGHWVASRYYRSKNPEREDGWFPTGDVGCIDAGGFVRLTDRAKDLIKSGGEWISSIELENIAISHPAVAEAAVIAATHPKWAERPLALVVLRDGCVASGEEIREFYRGKIAAFAIPDQIKIVDALPHGATGKLLKTVLRNTYGDFYMRGG